jgi:hypothetical protein
MESITTVLSESTDGVLGTYGTKVYFPVSAWSVVIGAAICRTISQVGISRMVDEARFLRGHGWLHLAPSRLGTISAARRTSPLFGVTRLHTLLRGSLKQVGTGR